MRIFLTACAALLVVGTAHADDQDRIAALEARVAALEAALNLSPPVVPAESEKEPVMPAESKEELVVPAPSRAAVITAAPSKKEVVAASGGWESRANWRNLQRGMSYDQVRTLLGEPGKVIGRGTTNWLYGSGGRVTFARGGVNDWQEPDASEMK